MPDIIGPAGDRDSAASFASSSEVNDQVHPMGKLKKHKSMAPKFDQSQFNNSFNEVLPRQFQINSYSQAQRRIEEIYDDLQKVVRIAKGYREDFLTLQGFIKDHFKSADLLFKNSGQLAQASQGESQMVKVLKSCFQETPMVAMAFASPLCVRVIEPMTQKERVDTMPMLDFAKEFKGAVQGIEETGNAINVQIVPATLEKFTNCLMQKPIGLHFTGHGVENNAQTLGQDTFLMSNQGNCLVFEKEDASAHFVSQQKLKDLFEMHVASLKFVFIATCHSEFAGEIFHQAGVDHVICVKQGFTIIDDAAVFFARKFYQTLFMEKYTICDSFKMAKNCLKMHPEYSIQQEADKLIMILNTDELVTPAKPDAQIQTTAIPGRCSFSLTPLPVSSPPRSKKTKPVKKEHQCCVLGPFMKREDELIEQRVCYPFEVAKLQEFVGRQREMQEIIAAVLQNRFTTVLGVPGIGKTTITKSIGFHLSERKTFHDGIMFFSLRGKDQTTALISMLFLFLQKHDSSSLTKRSGQDNSDTPAPQQSMLEKNRLLKSQPQASGSAVALPTGTETAEPGTEYKQDYLDMEQKVHGYLEAKQVLIIIDNLEDVLREDEESLRRFLTELLEKLPGVSILTTSRTKVQNLGEITECLYELKQLTNSFSCQLLEKKCLRKITEDEIRELFEVPEPMQQAFKTPFKKQQNTGVHALSQKQKKTLKIEDHHLCLLLGGHPHAISLVAPFLQGGRRLADLYKMLLNMIASEDFMKDMHSLDPTQSLKVSMDTSTLHMRNTQPEALNLFCMLGMIPGGVSEVDLPILWQSEQWLVLTESLRRASLIVERVEDSSLSPNKGLRTFRLLPFMNKYAESLLSHFDRIRFHNICCTWLLQKVLDIFKNLRTEDKRGNDNFKHELLQIETNIWACIYRICDFNRDHKATKKLRDQENAQQYNHQQALTGYSSAADEYEAVLLKGNLSIMEHNSDHSGDELASNGNRSFISSNQFLQGLPQQATSAAAATSQTSNDNSFSFMKQSTGGEDPSATDQSPIQAENAANISFNSSQLNNLGSSNQLEFSFNSNLMRSKMNKTSFSSRPQSRKISSEDHELPSGGDQQNASSSSLNDRTSGSLTGTNAAIEQYLYDKDTEEITEKPKLEDAHSSSSYQSDDEGTREAHHMDFEEMAKDKRRVSFALNTSAIVDRKKKSGNGLKATSEASLNNSYREKNNKSPFNVTLSQIDANSRESSDVNTMTTPRNFSKSIKVSKLSFIESMGTNGQNSIDEALGSIDQSQRNNQSGTDSSFEGGAGNSQGSQGNRLGSRDPPVRKSLVKSATQKFLHYVPNMVVDSDTEMMGDDLKRRSSITDNRTLMHYEEILPGEIAGEKGAKDMSFISEKVKLTGKRKQILTENVDRLNQDSSDGEEASEVQDAKTAGNDAFDISFNIGTDKTSKKSLADKTLLTNSSETTGPANISANLSKEPQDLTQTTDQQPQANPIALKNTRIPHIFPGPKESDPKKIIEQARRAYIMPGALRSKKQVNGSLTLKSQLEVIQENTQMSNDSLMIVAYISVLVLNQKYSDAIRAIEIVNSSEPYDPLLLANLKKLNAVAILKSETQKFHFQQSIVQAYKQFREAASMFQKIGKKGNATNESNLGMAACQFGMAATMYKNPFNFKSENMDEDQCLRHVVTLYESAKDIYKQRDHYGGASICLQNMAFTKKKLSQPYLNLTQESQRLRRQVKTWQPKDSNEGVPSGFIYRHDGFDISLLIEIVDRPQIYAIPKKSNQPSGAQTRSSYNQSNMLTPSTLTNKKRETKSTRPSLQSTVASSNNRKTKQVGAGTSKFAAGKKPNLSPQSQASSSQQATRPQPKTTFGRKSNKVYSSQTRENNQLAQTSQAMQAKTMQIISQNSTSTDDSVQTSLSNLKRPTSFLQQVKVNNFLSDATYSENEQAVPFKAPKSGKGRNPEDPLNASLKNKKKALEKEPLPEIVESTHRTKQIAQRMKNTNATLQQQRTKFLEKEQRRQGASNMSPRPSIKKVPLQQQQATKTRRPTALNLRDEKEKSGGQGSSAQRAQEDSTTIQADIEESKGESRAPNHNTSSLEIAQMAGELELHSELDEALLKSAQKSKDTVTMSNTVDDSSSQFAQSVATDTLNSSFTTNDERLRRQSITSNATSVAAADASQINNRRRKDKFAHVQARVNTRPSHTHAGQQATAVQGGGSNLQQPSQFTTSKTTTFNRTSTPIKGQSNLSQMRDSASSSTLSKRPMPETANPFSIAAPQTNADDTQSAQSAATSPADSTAKKPTMSSGSFKTQESRRPSFLPEGRSSMIASGVANAERPSLQGTPAKKKR